MWILCLSIFIKSSNKYSGKFEVSQVSVMGTLLFVL